jgi:hypothetical protein
MSHKIYQQYWLTKYGNSVAAVLASYAYNGQCSTRQKLCINACTHTHTKYTQYAANFELLNGSVMVMTHSN